LRWRIFVESPLYGDFAVKLDARKKLSKLGVEVWTGRDIQLILGYSRWENLEEAIERARMSCMSAGREPDRHFRAVTKMISRGNGAEGKRRDWYLTRFACYLIAINGDARKPEIAFAQTYFLVKARQQELTDQLIDEEKRIALRMRVKNENRGLASAAKQVGVRRFPIFQDEGYKGLYGGLGVSAIKAKKKISANEELLDCAGRAELAANEFRITQTEQKLLRGGIIGEPAAIQTHRDVGAAVRHTIEILQGIMPKNLPPEPSIKKLLADRSKRVAPRTDESVS
jgi:DNA-damage-inducible protein D